MDYMITLGRVLKFRKGWTTSEEVGFHVPKGCPEREIVMKSISQLFDIAWEIHD